MPIRLDSAVGIPQGTVEVLLRWNRLIQDCECLDDLLGQDELNSIVPELNDFCLKGDVVGIHYTRAIRAEIENHGLRPTSGEDRRRAFLEQYGYLFTAAQTARIRDVWQRYFDHMQTRARDNRIWFNLTLSALTNGGAKPLLEHFGGEQIYMPLADDAEIGPILRTLGEPLIISCALDPKLLTTFSEYPWGKVWLSSYHLSLNPNASQFDLDAYQKQPVLPDHILSLDLPDIRKATSVCMKLEGT